MESHLGFKFPNETPVTKAMIYIGFLRRISSEFAKSLRNVLKHLEWIEKTKKHDRKQITGNCMIVDDSDVSFPKYDGSGLKDSQDFVFMRRKHLFVCYFAPTILVPVIGWSYLNRLGRPRYST